MGCTITSIKASANQRCRTRYEACLHGYMYMVWLSTSSPNMDNYCVYATRHWTYHPTFMSRGERTELSGGGLVVVGRWPWVAGRGSLVVGRGVRRRHRRGQRPWVPTVRRWRGVTCASHFTYRTIAAVAVVVGRLSWVASRGSLAVGRWPWVAGRGSLVVGRGVRRRHHLMHPGHSCQSHHSK